MSKTGPKDNLNLKSVPASTNAAPLVAQDNTVFSLPPSGERTLSYDMPFLYQG